MPDVTLLKRQFTQSLDSILHKHRRGAAGVATALALTRRLDRLVQTLYASTDNGNKKLLALVALGGYGRMELNFASDTDLMFLVMGKQEKESSSPLVKELLHSLLDYGLEVGHSFRTIEECLEMAETDFDSWMSMLDSRFLCGGRSVYAEYRKSIATRIKRSDKRVYVRQLLTTVELRHQKYGNSTKLLEPNIKNSAGGLRDLHAALWLMRGTGLFPLSTTSLERATLLESAFMKRHFDTRLLVSAKRGFEFLMRTRNEMHHQAKGLHDTLEFLSQRRVAEALHYRNVERFMQDYYIAARSIARLTERVTAWAEEEFLASKRRTSSRPVHPHYRLRDHTLEPLLRVALSTKNVLEAAVLCVEHGARFSPSFEDRVQRGLRTLRPIRSKEEAQLFRRLFAANNGLSRVLHRLNDLGVLGRLIPEWEPMVAFFQHNVYHYYTADEHTLRVITNAESLTDSPSTFGEAFRSLPRRDTLYYACLLHDIAKPKRVGNHEVEGVKIAKTILHRLGADEILDDVLFLIRHHLLMEQVAFRRNLSDPQTILDFAAKFHHTAQLDYLYVLTYADLSAVNKNVWTDWKGILLTELYHKTREVLAGKLSSERVQETARQRRDAMKESVVTKLSDALAPEVARSHLDAVESPAYLSSFDAEEIAQHILALRTGALSSTIFKHQKEFTEVTMIAQDAPFALSKFCGVLTANDANILDANIFTRSDGMIIDKFRVVDFVSKSALTERQCEKIGQELEDVLRGRVDIEHLLHRHRMKWKRRTRQINPNVRVDIEFEDHPRYTIIDIFAFDTLGFLYKITGKMSQLGLNIAFAKIATRADGIVDSFYVTGLTGSKLDNAGQREHVKAELLSTVRQLAKSELVIT